MPAPNPDAKPDIIEDDLTFLDRPITGRLIQGTIYDFNPADNIVFHEGTLNIIRQSLVSPYKPASSIRAVLNSEPVDLGTFQTDGFGNLRAAVQIPSTVPTGYHTLHLYGTATSGKPMDVYRVIYVAHTEADKNGDGLDDADQPCGALMAANRDDDSDGLDDACDPIIAQAPNAPESDNAPPQGAKPLSTSTVLSSATGGPAVNAARYNAASNDSRLLGQPTDENTPQESQTPNGSSAAETDGKTLAMATTGKQTATRRLPLIFLIIPAGGALSVLLLTRYVRYASLRRG